MRTVQIALYPALGLCWTHLSVTSGPEGERTRMHYNGSYDIDLDDPLMSDREVLEAAIQALQCLHAELG